MCQGHERDFDPAFGTARPNQAGTKRAEGRDPLVPDVQVDDHVSAVYARCPFSSMHRRRTSDAASSRCSRSRHESCCRTAPTTRLGADLTFWTLPPRIGCIDFVGSVAFGSAENTVAARGSSRRSRRSCAASFRLSVHHHPPRWSVWTRRCINPHAKDDDHCPTKQPTDLPLRQGDAVGVISPSGGGCGGTPSPWKLYCAWSECSSRDRLDAVYRWR